MPTPLTPPEAARKPVIVAPLPTQSVATPGRRLADNVPTTTFGRLRENIQYTRGRGALEIGGITLAVVIAFCLAGAINPGQFAFLDPNNLAGVVFQSIPVFAILAIGVGILMIAGEFDLSLGASLGLSAIVFIRTANAVGWFWGAVAAIVTAVAIATINGIVVIVTKIPSFIATLGLGFFWTGASFFVNGTFPAILTPDATASRIFAGDFGVIRSQLLWMILVGLIAWFFLHRHKTGNAIFAVGGNANAAKAISINPARIKILSFAILGAMVGLAGILISVRTNSMQPGTTETFTLMSVAGAVVGGCSLNGGKGSVTGMVLGAALIQLIQNGLILANAPGFYVQLFVGLLIVVAAVFNKLVEGKAA
jgi:simple sugar transport system permease protein